MILSGYAPAGMWETFPLSVDGGSPDMVAAGCLWNCTDTVPEVHWGVLPVPNGVNGVMEVHSLTCKARV